MDPELSLQDLFFVCLFVCFGFIYLFLAELGLRCCTREDLFLNWQIQTSESLLVYTLCTHGSKSTKCLTVWAVEVPLKLKTLQSSSFLPSQAISSPFVCGYKMLRSSFSLECAELFGLGLVTKELLHNQTINSFPVMV